MWDAFKGRNFAAAAAALVLGLVLAGCSGPGDPEPADTTASTNGGASPSEPAPSGGDPSAASPDPSVSGDWWPEHPETMATGQEFPDEYEPATLEHPARNVPKPVMPDEAKHETEAGAQAFLDYYADVSWYALQTGDTAPVREVTSEHCNKCNEEFERIDSVYASGDWIAGGFEKSSIAPGSFYKDATGIYSFPVHLDSSGFKLIEGGKLTLQQEAFETGDGFNGNLDFEEGAWLYVTASPRSP